MMTTNRTKTIDYTWAIKFGLGKIAMSFSNINNLLGFRAVYVDPYVSNTSSIHLVPNKQEVLELIVALQEAYEQMP